MKDNNIAVVLIFIFSHGTFPTSIHLIPKGLKNAATAGEEFLAQLLCREKYNITMKKSLRECLVLERIIGDGESSFLRNSNHLKHQSGFLYYKS